MHLDLNLYFMKLDNQNKGQNINHRFKYLHPIRNK